MLFEGVNVAAITPRGKDGREVDLGAALDLIDFLCGAGVRGIAVLGSTGEFLNLSLEERTRLTYMAVKRSRVPVLAGVAHSSLEGAIELGREAASQGAAGLLLMPPYFFRYGQPEIREFYLRFAAQMPRGTPLFLYNIPFFTSPIEVETAAELLESGQFAGIKDSSGDPSYLDRLQRLPVTRLVGNDTAFARSRAAGADGVVSGVACALPELILALDRALAAGAADAVAKLDARLHEFIAWLNRFPVPVGIKEAVAQRGLKTGPHSIPLACETLRAVEEFRVWFRPWFIQVCKECAGV